MNLGLVAITVVMALGSPGLAPASPHPQARGDDAARSELLPEWLAAVDRHEPGRLDPAAIEIGSWPEEDLRAVVGDLDQLARFLVRAHARFRRSGQLSTFTYRRRSVSMAEARELLGLSEDEAGRGDVSRIVLRAALLHTDLAALLEDRWDRIVPSGTPPRAGRTALVVLDGRQLGLADRGPHWELVRALLDMIPAGSPHDESKRRWYVATAAHMQSRSLMADLVPHLARARQLFPADADVLFYSGSMNETLAAPHVQHALQEAPAPPGIKLNVTHARTHLQEARAFFARALESNPDLVEARVRLGRVLGLSGRHEEAARELQRALAGPADRRIRYYAALFLGEEQATLGQHEAARASFEAAAALYPRAQSPRLALSRLAQAAGNRAGAVAALLQVLTLPEGDSSREDPWWEYFVARETEADGLVEEWRDAIAQRERP